MTATLPAELIRRKRDGGELTRTELHGIGAAIADGGFSDAQTGAFAMAVFLKGFSDPERVAFTEGLRDSGSVLTWEHLDVPVVDKHSTGGVGDKVSLLLAPMLAACGTAVPMISGRGLGHTGGTLDKLDAIPGYASQPGLDLLRAAIDAAGCAVVGQTDDLAPADRRLYGIRDASGSVETRDLIVPSILSKKLAAGLHALVLDVKHGSGAFMASVDDARELAQTLVAVATGAGLPTVALLTDMDRVLGTTAGNALEVAESIAALTDPAAADPRLIDVTVALAERVLSVAGVTGADPRAALTSGAAADRFARMVVALGGPADLLERPDDHLAAAPVVRPVHPDTAGVVARHATRDLGLAVIGLGGGRRTDKDAIDHRVGLSAVAGPGTPVGPGADDRPLCVVHARTEAEADAAAAAVRAAIVVAGEDPPAAPAPVPVITEEVA
ncbi:Thymidine phosphorylase [Paraconexibacter sp. AEG42_29]|uniref:Thymidine phosphorylase n=1 Tax=Paraconexibacter sp. AEG42_29 TaxID=2997339 RepID=A0AAU7ASV4_9ACTN